MHHATIKLLPYDCTALRYDCTAVRYPVVTNEGKHERRVALLSEADDVYLRYRHLHIMVAMKRVPEEIKKFLNENAAAKLSKKKVKKELHHHIDSKYVYF